MARELRVFTIPDGLSGERVDAALARLLGLSRTTVAELATAGEISRAGKTLAKSERIESGDQIEILFPEPASAPQLNPTPVDNLEVIYDDDQVIVVNKPVGCASHPSPGWSGVTVIGGLIAAGYSVSTSGAAERQGIVHRLDVGTTGLMVVAKTETAYTSLKDQFRERTVGKIYNALAQGHIDPTEGTIDAPIDRHPKEDYRFAVVADGKPSITHYLALEYYPAATLLKVELETGRTHQIRVHFAALRHPLVGDLTYGADPALAEKLGLTRPWLHAMELTFNHPGSGDRMSFTAPYPADLTKALALLTEK